MKLALVALLAVSAFGCGDSFNRCGSVVPSVGCGSGCGCGVGHVGHTHVGHTHVGHSHTGFGGIGGFGGCGVTTLPGVVAPILPACGSTYSQPVIVGSGFGSSYVGGGSIIGTPAIGGSVIGAPIYGGSVIGGGQNCGGVIGGGFNYGGGCATSSIDNLIRSKIEGEAIRKTIGHVNNIGSCGCAGHAAGCGCGCGTGVRTGCF